MIESLAKLSEIRPGTETVAVRLNLSSTHETPDWLECSTLFRCVPKKRIACLGQWRGRQVFAKIFFDQKRGRIHVTREEKGVGALKQADLPTPALLFRGAADGDAVQVLLFEYLANANAGEAYWTSSSDQDRRRVLKALVGLIANHHQAGIIQKDLHLDNFLFVGDLIYTLDGADIDQSKAAIGKSHGLENLALLLAQLPVRFDSWAGQMSETYLTARGMSKGPDDDAELQKALSRWRRRRKKLILQKIFRESTEYICSKSWRKFVVYDRTLDSVAFRALVADPDAGMDSGDYLKCGNTSTVARVCVDDRKLVVKRYNIKNWRHGLNRAFRVSRAAISWRNAHRLRFYEIGTPKPVALLQYRWGPIRRKAYYIAESFDGPDCLAYFSIHEGDTAYRAAQAIVASLQLLKYCKISHGDMKGSNILVGSNRIAFIDLDAMREHVWSFRATKRIARDHRRFLKNWAADQNLREIFVKLLDSLRDRPC